MFWEIGDSALFSLCEAQVYNPIARDRELLTLTLTREKNKVGGVLTVYSAFR
jgi:hypothetical protein